MAFVSAKNKQGIHIAWKTVTYRSVMLAISLVVLVLLGGVRLAFPQFTSNSVKAVNNLASNLLERIAGAAGNPVKSGPMNRFPVACDVARSFSEQNFLLILLRIVLHHGRALGCQRSRSATHHHR